MGLMDMINAQRKAEKKVDTKVVTEVSVPSGILPLDYVNGLRVTSYNEYDRPVGEYDLIGTVSGSMNTIIGITGTGKTALAMDLSVAPIIAYGDMSGVQHYDIEQSSTMPRVLKATKLPPSMLKQTYSIHRDKAAEDIVDLFKDHCNMKLKNAKMFTHDTGVRDLYNDPIYELYPSSALMDSFAMFKSGEIDLSTKEVKDITNNMQAAQGAKFNKGILTQMISYSKKANVSLNCVNHINTNVNTGFLPKPSQQMYLNQDETLPGGQASLYLANNILKLKLLGKYPGDKPEKWEYGIPGFLVEARYLKSRTNAANMPVELIFDHRCGGFSKTLTLLHFAFKNELVLGTNRAYYLPGLDTCKFTKKTWEDAIGRDPEFLEALYYTCLPALTRMLSTDTGKSKKDEETSSERLDAMYNVIEDHMKDVEDYKKQGWVDFD